MASKDFLEKELNKNYDSKLMKKLLKYGKPYIYMFLVALFFLFVTVGTDLIRPYLLKITIDDYLFNDYEYLKISDTNDKFDFEFGGLKLDKIDNNKVPSEIKKDVYTLFKYKERMYLSRGIVNENSDIKLIDKTVLSEREENLYNKSNLNGINNIGLIFIVIIISGFCANFLHLYVLNKTSQTIIYNIRQDVYKHINKLPLSFFDKNPVGRIVTRVTNDTEVINEMFTSVLINFIKDIVIFAGVLTVMFLLSPKLTLISILSLPFVLIAAIIFRRFIREIYRKIRVSIAKINSILSEYISGMSIIQIFNKEKESIKKFNNVSNDYFKTTLKEIRLFALFRPYIEMVAITTTAIIIWYGGLKILNNELEFGIVIAFSNYIGMLYQPINDLAEKFNIFQSSMASSERIFQILDEEQEFLVENKSIEDIKIKGDIEFKNVWFYYNSDNYVLKDISFEIKNGETIAIVGSTGSGKTTIINLLNFFYNINSGSIFVDGKDIKKYNTSFLRESIAYVPQDVFLFKGNIIDNIRLDDDFSYEEIVKACRYVGADVFIEKFNEKYYHEVIEGGKTLSTGQRQLISFARALVRNPSILVLDEATSNIDVETEVLIQKALDKVSRDRTTIVIAHRLSTIKMADNIIVMKKGKVIETGIHEELIKRKSVYYNLYKLQYQNM
ncbi:MAG: ABC transporter ATP-binding protein [Clostridiales bacterium]